MDQTGQDSDGVGSAPVAPGGRREARLRELERVARDQAGMLARRQVVSAGLCWDDVEANVLGRRWVVRTPRVVSTFTGVPTVDQRRWLAVLHAGPRSMLGGLTAAEQAGLVGWEREEVTILVDDELSFEPVDGVRFFRSRRPFGLMVSPRSGIARARIEPAVLLWSAYQAATPRPAVGALAAVVQQRLTTPDRLLEWVDQLRPLRRAKLFRAALGDIADGAQSSSEIDSARMCRRFHLPPPARQVHRRDHQGRVRWTDCEWDLPDGTVLVLEIDGGFHMEVQQWEADVKRSRQVTGRRRIVVRCTGNELRFAPGEVAADLVALGLPQLDPSGRVPHAGP